MGHTVSVLGASGFAGGELLRLLTGHPGFEVAVASGGSAAGSHVADVHPHLRGSIDLSMVTLDEGLAAEVDVCFSALPHGELAPRVARCRASTIVDLSGDHRADPNWVYGLVEYARDQLRGASRIANPGCYPTATLLALLPFATAGAIEPPFVVDAISGLSGAGRRATDDLSFSTASAGATAYGDVEHRHIPEIERGLSTLGDVDTTVSFTPHLAPMARGLVVTARARMARPLSDIDANDVLAGAYEKEPFVTVTPSWPGSKAVTGTNRAHVSAHVDARAGWLIASGAIDNLGKGAAGQAIQNANLALGLEETTGLEAVGVWP